MAIDLSGGAFVDAFNKQENRLLARRAKNRDVYDKLMTDATDRGEKMTINQITDLRTEMSNGNNFFTGYVPRGEVLENQITRQNERAAITIDKENTERLKRVDEGQTVINNQADIFADKDLPGFIKGLTDILGDDAATIAKQNGGMEAWFKNSRDKKVEKILSNPRVASLMSEKDVDDNFGHHPKYIIDKLKGVAKANATKDQQTRITAAYGDIQKMPADILEVAKQNPNSTISKAVINTFVRGIAAKHRLPEGEIPKLLNIITDRIALGAQGYEKGNEDKFEQALATDAQLQQLIASDAAPDVVDARIRFLAELTEVGLPDDLNTSPQVSAFKDASLGSLKIADAAAYKASATSTQATYIELAGEKTEQAKANMAVAVLNIKKKAESGKNPAAMLAYTALNQFANSGYIPSDVNGAAQDAQALAEEAISQGMDVNEARTSIVNALINRGGTTTQSAMVARNMEVEIQRRHGIKPGTHIGYEGENGTYDKTVANAKELTDKLSKYFETVPSNKPERGEAQKTAAINNIKKVVSYLRDQLTENGHRFKGNRSEVEKQARELAERMAQAVQKIEDMQPSGAATTAVSLGASAMHSAVENGDAATVLAAITSNSATGNQALATANAEKIEALKQNVIEYAGVIQGVGPQAFAGLSRDEVDSKIMALSEALWNKLGKPNYATTSSIKDQFYMTIFGSLGITSEGNSYRLLSRQ